ncbi:MAG: SsrA-binding protein SmpB [Planctomycetota bacterium]
MARKKQHAQNYEPRIANRKAHHDYHIGEKLECGIQLLGTEVKSVRLGRVQLAEGYAVIEQDRSDPSSRPQLMLMNVDIGHYPHAGDRQHATRRPRRLLAHRRQIDKFAGLASTKGVTIVPLAMYFVRGRIKLEIGLGTGKKQFDKRQDLKKKQTDRDIQRAMTRKVL